MTEDGTQKSDERDEAIKYLNKHRIDELFKDLGTALAYKQPEDVGKFLIEMLKKKELEANTSLVTYEELTAMFNLKDVKQSGVITKTECRAALETLCNSHKQYNFLRHLPISESICLEDFIKLGEQTFSCI